MTKEELISILSRCWANPQFLMEEFSIDITKISDSDITELPIDFPMNSKTDKNKLFVYLSCKLLDKGYSYSGIREVLLGNKDTHIYTGMGTRHKGITNKTLANDYGIDTLIAVDISAYRGEPKEHTIHHVDMEYYFKKMFKECAKLIRKGEYNNKSNMFFIDILSRYDSNMNNNDKKEILNQIKNFIDTH